MGDVCFSTHLIDGDGVFNVSELENFMKEARLGKSTLLNHLFGTNFRKTDAFKGRCATISLYLSLNLCGARCGG
ncbi:hypothetical protein PVAP13_7KG076018 [Panicum virgatum]|uniref:Uncharacterized protein n=1 Tax=Panicum virgatum TaxID=38727 RepID=A0A8T0Q632_PANVG|nr:hypothetical protein PVAP13_7KG076018 [Panicum virgatum]